MSNEHDVFDGPDFVDADVTTGQAQAEAFLAEAMNPAAEVPSIPAQPDSFFHLPGSHKLVEVRELKGRDEEAVDRARRSPEALKVVQTIVECGTSAVGDEEATPGVLGQLLAGDREYLLLLIREATYGSEIQLGDTRCACGDIVSVTVEVEDIPVHRLDSPSDASFEVPLRKGGVAQVHLPTAADQQAVFANANLTNAERNTLLLTRCVESLRYAGGDVILVAGFPSVISDDLGLLDRRTILDEIAKRTPGPQYNDVTVEHECGYAIPVEINLMSLFPGL